MVRAIIPCAGYGTRMGMKSWESKEMMIDPENGHFIIDYSLSLCKIFGLNPLVILREEKTSLLSYIMQENIDYQLIEPEGEWPNTVLASQKYWEEDNILILPDTRFGPVDAVKSIKDGLKMGYEVFFANHRVPEQDRDKWGIVHNHYDDYIPKDEYTIYEKHSLTEYHGRNAWGLIGFKKHIGEKLFSGLAGEYKEVRLKKGMHTNLKWFKDITREMGLMNLKMNEMIPKLTPEEVQLEYKRITEQLIEIKKYTATLNAEMNLLQTRCSHINISPAGHGGYTDSSWPANCKDCRKVNPK